MFVFVSWVPVGPGEFTSMTDFNTQHLTYLGMLQMLRVKEAADGRISQTPRHILHYSVMKDILRTLRLRDNLSIIFVLENIVVI